MYLIRNEAIKKILLQMRCKVILAQLGNGTGQAFILSSKWAQMEFLNECDTKSLE